MTNVTDFRVHFKSLGSRSYCIFFRIFRNVLFYFWQRSSRDLSFKFDSPRGITYPLSIFSRRLSDSIRGCVPWKIRDAKILVTRNRDFWALLLLPNRVIDLPTTFCPCPLKLLPLPTRQRLLIGRVSGLVFLILPFIFLLPISWKRYRAFF